MHCHTFSIIEAGSKPGDSLTRCALTVRYCGTLTAGPVADFDNMTIKLFDKLYLTITYNRLPRLYGR